LKIQLAFIHTTTMGKFTYLRLSYENEPTLKKTSFKTYLPMYTGDSSINGLYL
jgi:hypothetical protein